MMTAMVLGATKATHDSYDHWVLMATAATAVGTTVLAVAAIAAFFVARTQLTAAATAAIADHDRRRKEATLTAWSNARNLNSDGLQTLYTELKDDSLTREAAHSLEFDPAKAQTRMCLVRYLLALERIAVGLELEIYDIDVIDQIAHTAITAGFDRWRTFIEEVRDHQKHQSAYSSFEQLAATLTVLRAERAPHGRSAAAVKPPVLPRA